MHTRGQKTPTFSVINAQLHEYHSVILPIQNIRLSGVTDLSVSDGLDGGGVGGRAGKFWTVKLNVASIAELFRSRIVLLVVSMSATCPNSTLRSSHTLQPQINDTIIND